MGAAATFVLAAVAGVVGNQLTGHLTPALVTFVVLLVVGMAITFLVEWHVAGRASGDNHVIGAAGKPSGTYDLRSAQGVQIGDANRQTNYFGPKAEPDRRE